MVWYVDSWLEQAATSEYWNKKIRYFKMPTSTFQYDGKPRDYVTPASEAFGLLVYDNCRDKWMKQYEWKQQGKALPKGKKDPNWKMFAAKYTDPNSGSKTGGGWKPEGLVKYEEYMNLIKKLRVEDAANQNKMQQLALDLVREKNEITATSPNKGRKRGKATDSPEPASKRVTVELEN
jgi:hypothetical protein